MCYKKPITEVINDYDQSIKDLQSDYLTKKANGISENDIEGIGDEIVDKQESLVVLMYLQREGNNEVSEEDYK